MGRPCSVQGAAVQEEVVRRVVVVGVQLEPVRGGPLAEEVPPFRGGLPVGEVDAAGGVVAGADVPEAQDVRDLALRVERGQGGVGDGGGDRAVVALGLQAVVVQPGAQQLRAGDVVHVPAGRVRVLVEPGELDLLVPDPGQLLEHLQEPGGQVGGVRVAADRVPDGVQDDAALAGRDQDPVPAGADRGGRRGMRRTPADGGRAQRGRRGHTGRRRQQLPPRQAEAAPHLRVVVAIDQIVHDAPLHEEGCIEDLTRSDTCVASEPSPGTGARGPDSHRSSRSQPAGGRATMRASSNATAQIANWSSESRKRRTYL